MFVSPSGYRDEPGSRCLFVRPHVASYLISCHPGESDIEEYKFRLELLYGLIGTRYFEHLV